MGQTAAPAIFLSYRRADTRGHAGRLADALEACFGAGSVFQDIETIAPGRNFAEAIAMAIADCRVLVVLIGDTWASERDAQGALRLADPDDFVRLEVVSALRAGKPVLPVFVERARMPKSESLPEDLRPLARLQGVELCDARWEYDIGRVEEAIRDLIAEPRLTASRRGLVVLGAVAALALVGAGVWWGATRPVDLAGRWELPSGSHWIVVQSGRDLAVEEVHHQSKEVWKRGRGRVDGRRAEILLDFVFERDLQQALELELAADGTVLHGAARNPAGGTPQPFTVTRTR